MPQEVELSDLGGKNKTYEKPGSKSSNEGTSSDEALKQK
jgi:hypothetical protein